MPAVGKNIPHDSAVGHVTGRSVFLDDVPAATNEALVDFLGSPVAHGRLKHVDLSAAAAIPGILALYTHADVPGHNQFGSIIKDEHLLASDRVEMIGDPIVLIAGTSREAINLAKKAIRLEVDPLPPIFTIPEAIENANYIGPPRTIQRGDPASELPGCEHILHGTTEIGGQEHFYLESQVAIATPGEHGQMSVQSSTQHTTEVQQIIAEVLGVPFNHVIVVCKRMGGGFGGKETQAALPAAMAAMVAAKLRRPARFVYNKDDDMRFTGKRHPFLGKWAVGFDSSGRIHALSVELFSNGGCTCDLSPSILERAMLHSDNAYFIPHFKVVGRVCKTNLPSNTAFRGFGGPQGVANTENVMEAIADHLGIDALDVRQANCYGIHERNITPYGQRVDNNTLPRLFQQLRESSNYNQRRREIDAFNQSSRTHLRGMSLTPVKFGISFTKKTLNQANALVNIYTDGSVMVSTGGTEMGQGLNTRVRQIVADELGVDYDAVVVGATSTEKNNNTSPTAASSGTDLNGAAAAAAATTLRHRLAEFASTILGDADVGLTPSPDHVRFEDGKVFDTRLPQHTMTFAQLICRAYMERINLGERGFYITPGVDFNRETGKGHPFLYYTNGAAVAEVLIDRFTGELKVERVDLLMDAGKCINPGIDRGQVTGGYIQGQGWVTTEELKYSPTGELLSHSPTTYKIPNISDVPAIFNVEFLDNPDNVVSLRGSKALGEPPLLLGLCAWTAVKNALASVSAEAAAKLALPATGEMILSCIEHARHLDRQRGSVERAPDAVTVGSSGIEAVAGG
jgi:xanthine dehydrogenase large subunit